MQYRRIAILVHVQDPEEVQAKQRQVGQVFLRQRFIREVRPDQAQPPQRPDTGAKFPERIDRRYAPGADQHLFDHPAACQEEADRASDFTTQLSSGARQIRGQDCRSWNPTAVEPLKGGDVTGFEAGGLSEDRRNGSHSL